MTKRSSNYGIGSWVFGIYIGAAGGFGRGARPAMMGEYILYYRNRVIGGIYDDRLLVKSTPGAAAYMPSATEELPYPGAKPMLLVDNVDDRAYLCGLFDAMVDDLPAPRTGKK